LYARGPPGTGMGHPGLILVSEAAHEQGGPHPVPWEARTVVRAHNPHLARPGSREGYVKEET